MKCPKNIVFVCHSNRNRSKAGEEIFSAMLRRRGYILYSIDALDHYDAYVSSAGTCEDADDNTNQFDKHVADGADIIFAADDYVRNVAIREYKQPREKIISLKIPDCYSTKSPELRKRLEELLKPYADEWYPPKAKR